MIASAPWLLVGLGNPGPRYAGNRHNVGFMVTDAWVARHADPGAGWRSKWQARTMAVRGPAGRCVVVQPQTYMNRSGSAVAQAAAFYRVPLERIVVVHDELDFPFGRVAIKRGGGHGGHNGLRDLIRCLPGPGFVRVRVGISRPVRGEVTDWVLSDFQGEDAAFLPDTIERAADAVEAILARSISSPRAGPSASPTHSSRRPGSASKTRGPSA